MNWDDLQVFLAVARAGRVSAAARRLQVEHTTVSRRLAALEEALGVPLFHRLPGGYRLTPHGQNVLSDAESMERAALAVSARARDKVADAAGRVRLALAPEFASHWLARHLGAFRTRHPQVTLEVLVGTRERDITRGEAELAVQSPRPRQQGLLAVRIARAALGLYASRAAVRDYELHPEGNDFSGVPLLVFTPPLHILQHAKWFQPMLSSAPIAMATNSTHALLAGARAGAGAAVLPRFVARTDPDLVAVSEDVACHDVWLITHPQFRRDPKVRATSEFLKSIGGEIG